jgi:tRNA pseudouridine55 synthase
MMAASAVVGAVLLNKPADITSFGALASVKRTFATKKVGHTGTLDRFATGLMVVLIGRATRLASLVTALDKSYDFSMVFGTQTDTLDPTGNVLTHGRVPSEDEIRGILESFIGELDQVPPAYSAVHVSGRRASDVVRSGGAPVLAPRRVRVDELELLGVEDAVARLRVSCGKGTYVRSLARDIASSLGTVAHVSTLQRRRVGRFTVNEAVAPEDVELDRDLMDLSGFLRCLDGITFAELKPESVPWVRNGAPVQESFFIGTPPQSGVVALVDETGDVVAVAEIDEKGFDYRVVLS